VIRPIASLLVAGLALATVSVGAEQAAANRKALMNPAALKAQAPATYRSSTRAPASSSSR
jgi:hypothetical protein